MITRPMEQKHLRRDEPTISGEEPPHHQLLIIRPSALFIAHEDGFSAKFSLLKLLRRKSDHGRSAPPPAVAGAGRDLRHRGQPFMFSADTADCAVGLLIDVMRKITAADGFVRRGRWPLAAEYPLGFKLGGKRVGIVGPGNIGSKVAKRLAPFGCNISYTSRSVKPSLPYDFYPTPYELASHSDILVICCPLTEDTRHMINREVMAALGKKGVIVNIGRGAIIDEKATVEHLVARTIAGAAMDVFENEPHVPTELFGLDNVVLSPHRGAFTKEAFFDAFEILNKPLISPVDTANHV